jgi:hypothetical protein
MMTRPFRKEIAIRVALCSTFLLVITLPAVQGVHSQYEFQLTCGDTIATAFVPIDVVQFFVFLENTGTTDDAYRIILLDHTPGWYLLSCIGGACYPPGVTIREALTPGQQVMIEVTFSQILHPDTGRAVLRVQSVGDTARIDSVTLWVLATTSVQTSVESGRIQHVGFHSRPNPFLSSTVLIYQFATDQEVSLEIYNACGEPVKSLTNGRLYADCYMHHWDGTDSRGERVTPGVYFCVLQRENLRSVCKLVLLGIRSQQ